MKATTQKLKDFFNMGVRYSIPLYQRAYSWEKNQWELFLEDLQDATKGENHYFFGNILLEKGENQSDIIDGQQRITTIVIFARALHTTLSQKGYAKTSLDEIEQTYLDPKQPKLQAVEFDRDYFKDVIIHNDDKKHKSTTPSQSRIKEAKDFFLKKLEVLEVSELEAILNAMQEAEILSIVFENKKDSVLMFELQNNRGKDLTNMEKLKSYLAYQIYTYCDSKESEIKLREMAKIFEEIYRVINDIKVKNEDAILNYFNISRQDFNYRENDDTKNYKAEFKKKQDSEKIAWVEEYVKSLKNAFIDFKDFIQSQSQNSYVEYLLDLDVWQTYPFILKAYTLFRNEPSKLEKVFKSLEVIALRDRLVKTKADLSTRLNPVLRTFTSIEDLNEGLKNIISAEEWYWSDENIEYALLNIGRSQNSALVYILKRYENDLRKKDTRTKGYLIDKIKKPEIEHISPQSPEEGRLKSGYDKYDEEFEEEYLHCIGNLLLLDGSHNASLGNLAFKEKLESYNQTPLQQCQEIKDFVVNEGKWDKEAIDQRHETIKDFILRTWSFQD